MTASREADDLAIQALCHLLDCQRLGELSGLASQSGLEGTRGELWSTILRRRLNNGPYETKQPSDTSLRAQWMYRHYHVRLRAYPYDGPKRSAAHVAQIWNGDENSVRSNASRQQDKSAAEEWINETIKRWQEPFPFQLNGEVRMLIDYKALDSAIARLAAEFPDRK